MNELTPEQFLERTNAVREIAGAMTFLFELVRDFRLGFTEIAGVGGETADLLAAQLFQTMILPRLLDGGNDDGALRAAAMLALETLRRAQRLDMTEPPVQHAELRAAIGALETALGMEPSTS